MSLTDPPGALHRFDRICHEITARGHGITLSELGDASALARLECHPDPDAGKVRALRVRLGLEGGASE